MALLATLALPTGAFGHGQSTAPTRATALAPAGCPGAPIAADRVITGEFGTELQGSYVLLPFDVPAGTTAVRVKYCYDQPDGLLSSQVRHTLDLGLYDARATPGALFGPREFRGHGGSSHPDTTVSVEGFSTEEQYKASPRGQVPGKTTRGFEPGPIPAGEWAVELGLAAVVPTLLGDSDGKVAWRVEIELSDDPAFADEPYVPAPYDSTPARSGPGWYAGDMHVHGEHSALGDATMTELFDFAFRPLSAGGAGLDFVTLSDYVTDSAWGEVGRYQPDHPGRLIMRSAEVITYKGHTNNHASATYVDYRTGPVYERAPNGHLELRRGPRPASAIFADVHAAGGFTQINHPTIFPSKVPVFALLCRGCSWEYTAEETDYSQVDAIEVATGPANLKQPPKPGPNPFTPLAIEFYESALGPGHRIAAVGSSDSHHAGRTPDPITQSPIGEATTVVYADELSEEGIQRGVEAGHTYVKVGGNDGPDVRLEARGPRSDQVIGIMGDTVPARGTRFLARVLGGAPGGNTSEPDPYELVVLKNRVPILAVPVTSDDFSLPFPALGPGRYRLQLQRSSSIEAVSSPIHAVPGTEPLVRAKIRIGGGG